MRPCAPRRLFAVACAVAWVSACHPVDTSAPAAPHPDVASARTSRASWLLTGSAEPGALVTVTRLPSFDTGAAPAPATVGDDGRFAIEVALAPARKNVFVLGAVDAAGLGSASAEVVIEQAPAAPSSIALRLADARPRIGQDGTATLTARATITFPDGRASDRPITFRVTGSAPVPPAITVRTDASGMATARIPGLHTGPGTIVATDSASSLASEDVPFVVAPGAPTAASIDLSASPASGPVHGVEIELPAGNDVMTRVSARDAAGNQVSAAYDVSVSPLDGVLVAGGVLRFTRPGLFTVTATLDGSASPEPVRVTGRVKVTTGPVDGATALVATFPARVTAGRATAFTLAFIDSAGVATAATAASITSSDVRASSSAPAKTVTLRTSGRQTLTFEALLADGTRRTAQVVTQVTPGPAASLEMFLAGSAAPLSSPRAVTPGADLVVTVVARDGEQNLIPDVVWSLAADAGVELFGATITSPLAPGTYAVWSSVPGTTARGVAVISVSPQPPAHVVATCPATAIAGVPFRCSAAVSDANGLGLSSGVTWSIDAPAAGSVDAGSLSVTTAGACTVRASAGGASGTATVVVAAARPANLTLAVSPSTLTVGDTAGVSFSVTDAFGNAVALPVALTTDLPGALLSAGQLTGVTRAGTFRVVAAGGTAGAGLTASQTITVSAGAASSVRLALASRRVVAGTPVKVSVTQRDASGNLVAGSTPVFTVDDAPIDGLRATFADGTITLHQPGAHRIGVTAAASSDSAIVDVSAARDTAPPDVSVSLDRSVAGSATTAFYKPGETVRITVRAHDDRGLSSLRVRLSGEPGLLLDGAWTLARDLELERTITVVLPTSKLGPFTVAASVSDDASSTDARPASGMVDAHYDRFTLSGALAQASARTVSIDPSLTTIGALALAGGVLHAQASAGDGPRLVTFGVSGTAKRVAALDGLASPAGLGASAGGYLFFGARLDPGGAEANMLYRLAPGAPSAQAYTVPPLATGATNRQLTSVAVDAKSTTGKVYAAETDGGGGIAGRLWSMPQSEADANFSVSSPVAGTLATWSPQHVCLPDAANPTSLYFTGTRAGGFVGLYKVALSAGDVGAGAITPTALYEQAAAQGGATILPGPCLGTPDGKVLFATSLSSGGSGKLQLCAASGCQGAGQLATVLTGSDLGLAGGLVRSGSALYVSETVGRLFRLDGAF